MINTSIHGVTRLTISEPVSMVAPGSGPYYFRQLTLDIHEGKQYQIDLFGESMAALAATESAEADYWRTQAAEESARADAAESLAAEWQQRHTELWLQVGGSERPRPRQR